MRHLSYLLRLWPTRTHGQVVWRASLESPDTGQRRGFASLTGLFAFLEQETSEHALGGAPLDEGRTGGDSE